MYISSLKTITKKNTVLQSQFSLYILYKRIICKKVYIKKDKKPRFVHFYIQNGIC